MANEIEIDYLAYVRKQLATMEKEDRPRLAVQVGLSLQTLYTIRKGVGDVKYGNVMKLYKAFRKAEAAKGRAAARKSRAS